MFTEISESEFLSISNNPIEYIGIYELNWLMDDNLLDCEGIIVAFEDRKILISSKETGEDEYNFVYYNFDIDYECRRILSLPEEPVRFIRKEDQEECALHYLRFHIGERPIIVTADYIELLMVGLSHWGLDGEWLEFENNNLLNDKD